MGSISFNIKRGVSDLVRATRMVDVAAYHAWTETMARYRRSALGPFWLVLSTIIGVVGLGVVWSTILHVERAVFVPSLTVALILWNFIAGCIVEASRTFSQQAAIIKNIKVPLFVFSFQLLLRQLINLSHNLVVVILVLMVYPDTLSLTCLMVNPGTSFGLY